MARRHPFSAAFFRLLACAAAALGVCGARAMDSAWSVRKWDLEDGLPSLAITGLTQAKDGFLWVATRGMLVRFDGLHFENFPSTEFMPGASRGFRMMVPDHRGGLWLSADPKFIVHLGASGAETFTMPEALPYAIAEDADGAVWVTYSQGTVCRIRDGRVETVTGGQGVPTGPGGMALALDRAGTLWWVKAGVLGAVRDGRFVALQKIESGPTHLAPAGTEGIWICVGAKLFKHDGHAFTECGRFEPAPETVITAAMLEDHNGALWIGTASAGLFRYTANRFEVIPVSDQGVSVLSEDHEGNLWVGTNGGGLERVQRRAFQIEGVEHGLPPAMVQSVCEDAEGNLWAATRNGMLMKRVDERWVDVIGPGHPFAETVLCVTPDKDGAIWVGTRNDAVLRLKDGEFRVLGKADGLRGHSVHALFVSRSGDLWIGGEAPDALSRLRNGQVKSFQLPAGVRRPRPMAEDDKGNIWVRGDGGLLRVGLDDAVDKIGTIPTAVRTMLATPDGSLWIGYGGAGLVRVKGDDFSLVGTEQGLHDGRVSELLSDGLGWFWIGSDRGIFKVAQSELESVMAGNTARVRSTPYARTIGLPSQPAIHGEFPNAARSRDGRLWMPLRTGLAVIYPDRLPHEVAAPAVRITQVSVDGQPVAAYRPPWAPRQGLDLATGGATVQLESGHRRLELAFTALTFRLSENVQFRYKLEGHDDEWVDAGRQRVASYSRMPAGHYRFRVSASNSDGVWNDAGPTVTVVVAPFFWQTWWFKIGTGLVFTLGVIAGVRYGSHRRLRAKLKTLEQQVALDRERARIARDIHDDLGGSLTQIALLSDRARESPEGAASDVESISTRVHEGIRSLDEIVWAINPANDTLEHLLDYIAQYAVDFLRLADIRCEVDLPVTLPARVVSAEVRHNLFLTVKESLNNIVRHACADVVTFRGVIAAETVEITISDNGRGFDESAQGDVFANGVRNLHQRMKDVGGSYSIRSARGSGTTVLVVLRHATAPSSTNVP
jgi:signal transduction histidine kinase/ligand-binding sensor domain-containing protein